MTLLKSFTKDTFVYGLGRSLKKFIGFFLLPFYTRALTPSDYGILETLGTAIVFLTAFLSLGLNQGAGRYFFMAKTSEEKGQILFNLLVFRIFVIIPSIALIFFSRQISVALFGTENYSRVVFLSCLIIPLMVLNADQDNIYRYFREPWKFNAITIIRVLLGISLGISLVIVMRKGVYGAQLASLISSFTIFILSYVLYTKKKFTYRFNWYWAKRMIKYSLPLVWAGIASWIFYSSDRFFILHFKDTTEVGLYSIGNTLSQPLMLLNTAIKMSYGPLILGFYEAEISLDKPKTKTNMTNIWHLYLLVAVTIGVFLSIFSVDLIRFITTPSYLLGALAMPFIIFATIASMSITIVSLGMAFKEKSGYFAVLLSIAAFLNVGLNFYFVPRYGFVGAAITTLISSLVYFLLTYYVSQKLFFVERNEVSIIFYFLFAFALSIFFPVADLVYHIRFDLWIKAIVFILSLILPFVTGFVKIKTIKSFIEELRS